MKHWLTLPLILVAVAVTATISWNALARDGVRATYSTDFGLLTVDILDARHMRLSSSDALELLISGGEGYLLRREGDVWAVMPIIELFAITGGNAIRQSEVRARRTNETEEIAGFRGERFQLESRKEPDQEWTPSGELVLSKEPATIKLGVGFAALAPSDFMVPDDVRHSGSDGEEMDETGPPLISGTS